ncbi:hypothetical protein B0H13DRAFT_2539055 [Mycena leptocephala]|nr:hypothetical protein B0H13DRAFT_2539055 [Mycena leptocephala]
MSCAFFPLLSFLLSPLPSLHLPSREAACDDHGNASPAYSTGHDCLTCIPGSQCQGGAIGGWGDEARLLVSMTADFAVGDARAIGLLWGGLGCPHRTRLYSCDAGVAGSSLTPPRSSLRSSLFWTVLRIL